MYIILYNKTQWQKTSENIKNKFKMCVCFHFNFAENNSLQNYVNKVMKIQGSTKLKVKTAYTTNKQISINSNKKKMVNSFEGKYNSNPNTGR